MNIQTILVPTDFSEHADRALETAIELARTFDASLRLIHVYDIPDTDTVYEVTFPTGIVEGMRKAASQKLDSLKARVQTAGIECSTELAFGSPSQVIVDDVREANVDMIVMGTHGHGRIQQFFLGSVAERTLRNATCPVLTIGPNTRPKK